MHACIENRLGVGCFSVYVVFSESLRERAPYKLVGVMTINIVLSMCLAAAGFKKSFDEYYSLQQTWRGSLLFCFIFVFCCGD